MPRPPPWLVLPGIPLPSPAWHAFASKPYRELDITRSTSGRIIGSIHGRPGHKRRDRWRVKHATPAAKCGSGRRGHACAAVGDRQARDVVAVLRHFGGSRVRPVLAGHSMGAYVALLARDAHPELVRRLVLVDGGLPLPVPDGTDLDAVLDATLGPAI